MMRQIPVLIRDRGGASAIEFSIAAPILVMLIWGIFQFGLVFQAAAGMDNALARGARLATIWPTPSDTTIQAEITSGKFGVSNGTWSTPTIVTDNTAKTKTITVTYSQPLNFLFFNGPTVTFTRSKVVHLST
jgi:Flp pilus assembly protein TadG